LLPPEGVKVLFENVSSACLPGKPHKSSDNKVLVVFAVIEELVSDSNKAFT
jgi:hypothetical protein